MTGALLEGAKFYIGDKFCGTLDEEDLLKNHDHIITCGDGEEDGEEGDHEEDEDEEDDDHGDEHGDEEEGLKGNYVRIEANRPGIMTICDLEI